MIFLGDSITDSDRIWDDDPRRLGHGYVRYIADHANSDDKIINRGHNGFTAYQVNKYLEKYCLKYLPDTVTLLVGINDVAARMNGAGGYDSLEYESYLNRILQRIKERGVTELIVMEPFLFPEPAEFLNWMGELELFQKAARRAAEANKACFVPLAEIFKDASKRYGISRLTVDGIHLTSLGHKILANAWIGR